MLELRHAKAITALHVIMHVVFLSLHKYPAQIFLQFRHFARISLEAELLPKATICILAVAHEIGCTSRWHLGNIGAITSKERISNTRSTSTPLLMLIIEFGIRPCRASFE